jgi:DNA-directed RNA polymerase I, II, and III subunit RPABC2
MPRRMWDPMMVELEGEMDPLLITVKELKARKILITNHHYLPHGCSGDPKVDELIITDSVGVSS